jgi:hypothetical protein
MGKKAFIIGKNTHGLQFAESDADLFGRILKNMYDFEVVIVKSKIDFQTQFEEFLDQSKTTDDLIIYFSGHAQSPRGTLELLLDENTSHFRGKIKAEELFPKLIECEANQKLVILDCCRAGTVLENRALHENVAYRILVSSPAGGRSIELENLKGGFFTYQLCKALTTDVEQIISKSDEISINEIFQKIKSETLKYNYQNNANVSAPKLMGDQGLDFSFGRLGKLFEKSFENNKIFLSVPLDEDGLKNRERFISQAKGRQEHANWGFQIVPSNEDAREMIGKHQNDFELSISQLINESAMAIQMIDEQTDFNNNQVKIQYQAIELKNNFSIGFKRLFWLINTDVMILSIKGGIFKEIGAQTTGTSIDKIFGKIDEFNASRFKSFNLPSFTTPGTKKEVILIFHPEWDDNNENRIQIKDTIENEYEHIVRPYAFFRPRQDEIDAIANSDATIIFFGSAPSAWFYDKQEIVLFEAKGRHRKFVYVDVPEADDKCRKHVAVPKYDAVFKGNDIADAFKNL